jgi:predicted RNA-binding Zn ribbon-like protein
VEITRGQRLGEGWQLIGGDLALDLVNTVAWRASSSRATDLLADPDHLADWLSVALPRHGRRCLLQPTDLAGRAGDRALADVRALREATADALGAQLAGDALPIGATMRLREAIASARALATVPPTLPLRHVLAADAADRIAAALALAVEDLCSRTDLDRLRRCSDGDCGWLFLDVSRNRSRRWCDPGDCGNRSRVRAFSARRRSG